MNLPILIAQTRNAIILKKRYRLGWFLNHGDDWCWYVWGSSKNLESAIKLAEKTVKEKGYRQIFVSDKPLIKTKKIQNEIIELTEIKETENGEKKNEQSWKFL